MSFKKIIQQTHCIYAKGATLEYYDGWNSFQNFTHNLEKLLPMFIENVERSATKPLDGIVLEIKIQTSSVDQLASLTRQLLFGLNAHDPGGFVMDECTIAQAGWVFYFGGMPLHLLTFSDCYPPNHPRHNHGLRHTYFLFQPHTSFYRRRDATGAIPEKKKLLIRRKFADADIFYNIELAQSEWTACKFVKPISADDPPVKWWSRTFLSN